MELNELIHNLFQLECKLFMKMDSYYLIEQKCKKKCLNAFERQMLNTEIRYAFTYLIKIMMEACPSLTEEDLLFCCLGKLGLNNQLIGRCMGCVNKQPINQRKYRVKKKIKEAKCESFFEFILLPIL